MIKNEVKIATFIALSGFLWVLLEYFTGLHSHNIMLHETYTWFAFLPTILIYVLHYKTLRKEAGNTLKWKKGFVSGLIITLIAIPFSQLGFIVFYYLVNPNFFSVFIKYTVDNKIMTAAIANEYFTITNYMIQIGIGVFFTGILLSAILSFLFKSKKASK